MLLFLLFAVSVIVLACFFFWSSSLSNRYPDLFGEVILTDTIVDVISDGRASARVTFKSGKMYTLPWAKMYRDTEELNLPRMVSEGDILIKRERSDTIVVIRGNVKYTFVAYKLIELPTE